MTPRIEGENVLDLVDSKVSVLLDIEPENLAYSLVLR